MITTLVRFTTEKELSKLTGLDHEALWNNGFNLDDWDFGFQSDKELKETDWLSCHLDCYCCGCEKVKYKDKFYYIAYHA